MKTEQTFTTTETKCAVCGDEMTISHSNYAPIWSDHYDNVVCFWCGTHPNIESEGQ
jgi:ribosomal protein S27E